MAEQQARTAAEAPPTCDGLNDQTCEQSAVASFRWEWGAVGVCCAEHQMLLQQTAESLGRKVTFAPLGPPAPVPLQRDERTQLIAGKLSAEAELEEVKLRGGDLYRESVKLTAQVQTLTVQRRELDALLQQAAHDVSELQEKLNVRDTQYAELVLEVERLRTIEKFVDRETAPVRPFPNLPPASPGNPTTTVVDG